MELKQGTLLQGRKYKIEATLGRGSFGITYLATARFITQGGLGAMEVVTKVAIKEFFMHEVNVRDRDGRSVEGSSSSVFTNYRHRFRREAENLAKLRHPNIIRVYDVFDENGTTYYSMAYVEGTTLDEYIRQHHPLAEADAVAIFGRVCSALSSMHEQRMLHLDLKPKNIMRSTQGEVFLIDFGLSKQFGANGEPESSTTIGAGTPGYAPFEQANPIKDGTFPATLDIYALGATIYKTLTGQRPPVATDVLNEGFPLEPLVQHRRSESLIKAIARCMSPMKKDRYQTVAELLRDCPALAAGGEETIIDEPHPANRPAGDAPVPPRPINGGVVLPPSPKQETPMQMNNRETKPKEIKPKSRILLWSLLSGILILVTLALGMIGSRCFGSDNHEYSLLVDLDSVPTDFNDPDIDIVPIDTLVDEDQPDRDSTYSSPNQLHFTVEGVTFTMVHVEGGTFTMGATSEQTGAEEYEKPAHQVTLSDYYIGQTEVTQALWKAVTGYSPTSDGNSWTSTLGLGDNYPAYYISYNDVQSFITKLNSLTGSTFRMPTEAEWEYAARGGSKRKGYLYSGSNTLSTVGWYDDHSGSKTHPVAQKTANELGLYDMSGNVWEWCSDWYGSYSSSAQTNPTGPSTGSYRIVRGGSWYFGAAYCPVARRLSYTPSYRSDDKGVRLVLSSSQKSGRAGGEANRP